ncbi:MAG: methylated-DNA--[protein]-cysteine S-methyltransferase [Lentisphaeria bacterium]|jgi:methylated-DNA-[protein]-cysteine S-methyltransferase|nr:methylated-DNA--[protein]-cysteine S-methyltransferase [Lentisphaeria bacterium]MDY0175769.1 methylated-DNA--[protein]-cysteine S-methyltransferase [Lentisphaeria bacterium]NLZ59834.1 methylated-DNA--[protein]-cysteine S-methyltransferase [Lentisphaerota bacterium]
MYYSSELDSPFGTLTLGCSENSLVGLWLEGQKYFGDRLLAQLKPRPELPYFQLVKDWLQRYFERQAPSPDELNLAPLGSEFRQQVWKILCQIPYGEVLSYGDIAKQIGQQRGGAKMSSQAVGGAVGHNPISIIIPCHRVVGAKGNLTGYGGGIKQKIKLLEHEGLDMSRFFVPKKGTAL